MNRKARTESKLKELFGDTWSEAVDLDPDFTKISHRFIYGDIFYQGDLEIRLRMLINLVVLATLRNHTQFPSQVGAALAVGVQPRQIKEALYQCAPFIGFPAVFDALQVVNTVLADQGVALALDPETSISEEDRHEAGAALQTPIYGDRIKANLSSSPEEHRESIPRYLTEVCFGDFYTRSGLDLRTREILILCVLCALGGTEVQIRSHAAGNLKVGNTRETIVAAVTQCLPLIGFPRTLNSLNIIKEVIVEPRA